MKKWVALVRPPSSELAHGERTFLERTSIDVSEATRQHDAYCRLLAQLGAIVIELERVDHLPDAVFVEDTAVVLDEVAIVSHLGVASRRPEADLIEPVLRRWRPTVRIVPPATLEGGDVLRIGRRLWVGLSRRTNASGIEALRALVEPLGYEVTPVRVSHCLHLKTACCPLPDGKLLVNPKWVDISVFAALDCLPVPPKEPWGANVLAIGNAVVVSDTNPQTASLLREQGYAVHPVRISELAKAEAGVTCLALCFMAD